ncbi:hypothetical protein HCH_00530 [Hahella chejuensis KCTC 2396]|uniref:Uncharacterized protein n=1 Tax=Hahella chejuensis (strain KCTC 2396) TaxID=349521 RepID=Q2SPI8_HAHCH|nr:hypothetical protein HCH_00530 [Hahella chejuensis KCTC 2396]
MGLLIIISGQYNNHPGVAVRVGGDFSATMQTL